MEQLNKDQKTGESTGLTPLPHSMEPVRAYDLLSNDKLKYLSEDDRIQLAILEHKALMRKKEEYVNQVHRYKISDKGKDGRYHTTVAVDGKMHRVAKTNRNDLINYLYKIYAGDDPDEITFRDMFAKFKEYKEQTISENSILRYENDFKRFFAKTKFSGMKITEISQEDCEIFLINRIRDLQLCRRSYEALWSYVKGTLKMARNKHFIKENPMDFLNRKDYFRHCTERVIDPKKRIVSDDEFKRIKNQIELDHKIKPNFMTGYAVELASMTGMRVGEIAALSWDRVDFENKVITVDRAEIFHQKSKVYTIGRPKNGKARYIPITEKTEKLLKRIREVEEKYGFLCEWVFANEDGRIHKRAMTDCARNKSRQAHVPVKTIHAYRRTVNSRMKANGVSSTVAAAILGHTVEVNERNYTYDVTPMDFKNNVLSEAQM